MFTGFLRTPGARCVAPVAEPLDLPTRYPSAQRIVAIGDLHRDLIATRTALRLAGAIDERDRWVGGTTVVVQTGDQLDRNVAPNSIQLLSNNNWYIYSLLVLTQKHK